MLDRYGNIHMNNSGLVAKQEEPITGTAGRTFLFEYFLLGIENIGSWVDSEGFIGKGMKNQ